MKLFIALTVLFLLAGIAEAAVTITTGDIFDVSPDGTYLQYDGMTVDGTILVTRMLYGNVLNYFPVPMGRTMKAFSWYILDVKYTFSITSDGRLTVSE